MLTAIAAKGCYGINAVFRPILEYPLPLCGLRGRREERPMLIWSDSAVFTSKELVITCTLLV